MGLLGLELANIYQNLTNIVLTITPRGCDAKPAVLLNAHYDSAVGSPGQPHILCFVNLLCCNWLIVSGFVAFVTSDLSLHVLHQRL